MSEYMKDSGHRTMRTCDDCGGAFFCGDVENWDEGEDDSAPDWACETCTKKDATIKALADALDAERSISGRECLCFGKYTCTTCQGDAALRLAGRL